jgi:hypothetical protein
VNADHSTSGRFVMFRVRDGGGTGAGAAEIRIPGFPIGNVTLASASIGYVRIKVGEGGDALPQRAKTFERDVYHFFTDKLCNQTCHKPGGIGYMRAPVRLGTDGMMYPADYSGTVDQVYDVLTKPVSTDCEQGGDKAARVCKPKPEASLLYLFPAGMGDHPGVVLQPDDPMLVAVLQWIKDGALLR